jgi:hypothetical protein
MQLCHPRNFSRHPSGLKVSDQPVPDRILETGPAVELEHLAQAFVGERNGPETAESPLLFHESSGLAEPCPALL